MKLIKFMAPWCNPCKNLSTSLLMLPTELKEKFPLEEINIEQHPSVATGYGVRGIPTLVVVNDNGQEISRRVGNISKDKLEEWLRDN